MKIEKLGENKIRIILSAEDLKEKNVNFHSFMANPIESQELLVDVLHQAEEEVGFVTKDHKIMIETLALPNETFVLTVTKEEEDKSFSTPFRPKVQIKRKSIDFEKEVAIFSCPSFEEVCAFCRFLQKSHFFSLIESGSVTLYQYQNEYYLCFHHLQGSKKDLICFYSSVSEFGTYIHHSDLFERKLAEYGIKVIDQNTISVILEKFC